MKRSLLLFVLVFIFFTCSNAQDIHYGVKGGVNYASVVGEGIGDIDGRIGFHAGIFADIPFLKKFSFHPEILFSSQGYKRKNYPDLGPEYDSSFSLGSYDLTVRNNYITVPLMTKFHFNDKLNVEIGPQLGFLLNSATVYEWENTGEKEKTASAYDTFDIGPTLGFGYNINTEMELGIRYYLGLSDLFRKDKIDYVESNLDWFDSVIQLSFSYTIF